MQVVLDRADEFLLVERDEARDAKEEQHQGLDRDGGSHYPAQETVGSGQNSGVELVAAENNITFIIQVKVHMAGTDRCARDRDGPQNNTNFLNEGLFGHSKLITDHFTV